MANVQTKTLFVALEESARHIVREAGKEDKSNNPVVREVLDKNLGFIGIAAPNPADEGQEKIIALHVTAYVDEAAKTLTKAVKALTAVPGVKAISTNFFDLSPEERPGQRPDRRPEWTYAKG